MLRRLFPVARDDGKATAATVPVPPKLRFLTAIDIFRDLTPEEVQSLGRATRLLTVPRGQVIYHQGDTAQVLFLLKRGRVRLAQYTPDGKKLELAVLGPHTFFGEMPLLGERMRRASAEAVDDCTLCVMSEADVERLILEKPCVARRMLEILGRRLADAEDRLQDLAYRTVPARLASVLLRLAPEPGGEIEGLTHQELGTMVGAYRETVTKTLNEFRAAGYIELGRRHLRLLDRVGLMAVRDGCAGEAAGRL